MHFQLFSWPMVLGALTLLFPPPLAAHERQLLVHGFRNPATGVEVRQQALGFVVGFFPDIVDQGADRGPRTTWFTKTGLFWYPLGLDAGGAGRVESYLGLSLVQGLGNAWNVSESVTHGAGLTFDAGVRWALVDGLDLRLGGVALVGFDGRVAINPAPGIGWALPGPGEKAEVSGVRPAD